MFGDFCNECSANAFWRNAHAEIITFCSIEHCMREAHLQLPLPKEFHDFIFINPLFVCVKIFGMSSSVHKVYISIHRPARLGCLCMLGF